MGLLDTWTLGDHRASGVRHPTYRKGTGPGVIVVHEIPGLTPEVIGFGEELVEAGYTVVMPHLFGQPEKPMNPLTVAGSLRQVCVSREFTVLATRQTSPIAGWLRSLARELHAEAGGPGVGALGMCFTGGFALAMMVDDAVAAPSRRPALDAVPGLPRPVPRPQPLRRRPRHRQVAGGGRLRGAGPALPERSGRREALRALDRRDR